MTVFHSIGFPISTKENEFRRALVASDIVNIKHPEQLYFEKGYGHVLGLSDEDYRRAGANVVRKDEVLGKEIICDPKVGDSDYLELLNNQIIFGWIHAVQNRDITRKIVEHNLSSYAWEDMYENGRHCFWRNNEIAGEAAVFHAFMCHGIFPCHKKVAVLGRGNSARGAIKMLTHLGADVFVYDRKTEDLFREELPMYDAIVNAVLWDTTRRDHIISVNDLKRMKKDALIIDVSCDRNGGVESSIPTTISNPTYFVQGIRHYVVDHTPALFWKTTSESLSEQVTQYIDYFIEGTMMDNKVLSNCHITDNGVILDNRIKLFQNLD